MSDPYHWMPFFWGDYHRDTTSLTTLEHGAYLLLISAYWNNHGPLPCNEKFLRATTKTSAPAWKRICPCIARFFVEKDGKWIHYRIEQELAMAKDRHGKRTAAAIAGGKARASSRLAERKPDASGCPATITIPITTGENIYTEGKMPEQLRAVELPAGFPQSEKEAAEIASFAGVPADFAVQTWHKAASRGGRDSKDVPVRNFRSFLAVEWGYHRTRLAQEKARGPRPGTPPPKKGVHECDWRDSL